MAWEVVVRDRREVGDTNELTDGEVDEVSY